MLCICVLTRWLISCGGATPVWPQVPVSCYLDIDNIIRVAKEADVDAIHPG
jgi:pyruvate carboxylase